MQTWWRGDTLPLAVDATALSDRLVVLAVAVLYRDTAIPVAWHVADATRPGGWVAPLAALLAALAPAVPPGQVVVVLADRGLWSPRLWEAIRGHGWHPLRRVQEAAPSRPRGGKTGKAAALVPGPGHAWVGRGTAFKDAPRREDATLIVTWEADQAAPCLVRTALAPDAVDPCWYGLRARVEPGFRALKSGGWHWERTRRTAPDRAARHWWVLAVAALWVVATGTRVEDAERLGVAPANLRVAAPPPPPARPRAASVFARGPARLRWQPVRVRRPWPRIWPRPDAWPGAPPNLQVLTWPH